MVSGKVEGQRGEPDLQRVMELLEHSISQPGYYSICIIIIKKKHLRWAVGRLKIVTPIRSSNPFPSFIPE